MKITKKIAAATLVPAAVTGITVSSLAVASAADQPSGQADAASSHPTGQVHQRDHAAPHTVTPKANRAAQKRGSTAVADSMNRARVAKAHAYRRAHAKPAPAARPAPATQPTPAAQPAPATQPAKPTSMFAGMSAFQRCVAWRESGNNPTASSAGLFGILPSTWASLGYPGTAGTSSVALQKQAFDRLYAMYGTSPWAPYDGC
jgi:hypothetical protein